MTIIITYVTCQVRAEQDVHGSRRPCSTFQSRVERGLCRSAKGQRVVSSLGSAWATPYLPCESFSAHSWMVTYQSCTPLLGMGSGMASVVGRRESGGFSVMAQLLPGPAPFSGISKNKPIYQEICQCPEPVQKDLMPAWRGPVRCPLPYLAGGGHGSPRPARTLGSLCVPPWRGGHRVTGPRWPQGR